MTTIETESEKTELEPLPELRVEDIGEGGSHIRGYINSSILAVRAVGWSMVYGIEHPLPDEETRPTYKTRLGGHILDSIGPDERLKITRTI